MDPDYHLSICRGVRYIEDIRMTEFKMTLVGPHFISDNRLIFIKDPSHDGVIKSMWKLTNSAALSYAWSVGIPVMVL